jgi:glycosyltransferase involved in cell wall biosynthesis
MHRRSRRPERTLPTSTTSLGSVRFVHLSFEGPDPYSRAGGLAIRVTTLAGAMAAAGALVDLYFVGDPALPGIEERDGVTLHRWCQAISAHAPSGVYDQEERKIEDLCIWLPAVLADVVAADRDAGRRTIALAEDWHMAWPLIAVHEQLVRAGLRDAATLVWTANNRFGFDRIDFERLAGAAKIFTISRAMKHLMWQCGVNPTVVPNGVPTSTFSPVPREGRAALRNAFSAGQVFAKVGRWDPDKRWPMALETIAALRDRGERAVLLARGWNGTAAASAHYRELRAHADQLGLTWAVCHEAGSDDCDLAEAVTRLMPDDAGVIELALPVEGRQLQILYAGVDAVLANSGFEPFGLVGLEAMAAGAVVITGATGEDYVIPFENGFALDTDDAREIVRCLDWLRAAPDRDRAMRANARASARRYDWMHVIERLTLALEIKPNDL